LPFAFASFAFASFAFASFAFALPFAFALRSQKQREVKSKGA
jgi:hypothetical protein